MMPRAALSDVTNNHTQRILQRAEGKAPLLQQRSAFPILADPPFKTSASVQNTAPRGRNKLAVTVPAAPVAGIVRDVYGKVGTENHQEEQVVDNPQEAADTSSRSVLDDTHNALINCIEELNNLCASKPPSPAAAEPAPSTVWHDCPEDAVPNTTVWHDCPEDAASRQPASLHDAATSEMVMDDAVTLEMGVNEGETLSVAMHRLEDELGHLATELQLSPALPAPLVENIEAGLTNRTNPAPSPTSIHMFKGVGDVPEVGAAERTRPPQASRTSHQPAPVTSASLSRSSPEPAEQPRSPSASAASPVQSSPPIAAQASSLRRALSPQDSLSAAPQVHPH